MIVRDSHPLGTTPEHVTCPACGGVFTAVVHDEGRIRYRFAGRLPVMETERPRWVVLHADGTECEVRPADGRLAAATAIAAMRAG